MMKAFFFVLSFFLLLHHGKALNQDEIRTHYTYDNRRKQLIIKRAVKAHETFNWAMMEEPPYENVKLSIHHEPPWAWLRFEKACGYAENHRVPKEFLSGLSCGGDFHHLCFNTTEKKGISWDGMEETGEILGLALMGNECSLKDYMLFVKHKHTPVHHTTTVNPLNNNLCIDVAYDLNRKFSFLAPSYEPCKSLNPQRGKPFRERMKCSRCFPWSQRRRLRTTPAPAPRVVIETYETSL